MFLICVVPTGCSSGTADGDAALPPRKTRARQEMLNVQTLQKGFNNCQCPIHAHV